MTEDEERATAKEGMRVVVFEIVGEDGQLANPQLGTIMKVDMLTFDNDDGITEIISENYPCEILLDDGTTTEGLNCWWYPSEKDNL